ncbi:MAG TPA: hypothetical protein PKE47_07760 [Verrucomicrobiota bacterium]|nr:hypothetical protein [Verrucomicrobiota bacterium]
MLLRVLLVVALVAGVAGIGVSYKLHEEIGLLSGQRDQYRSEKETAQAERAAAERVAKKATDDAKEAQEKLAVTEEQLAGVTRSFTIAEQNAARLSSELERTTADRNTAQRELAAWKATGLTPDRVEVVRRSAEQFRAERDAFAEEKKVMGREIARLTEDLKVFRGELTEVPMPDVRGSVLAGSEVYGFVVIDRGADAGLKENGKIIISRNNELIAKARIVRLEPGRAIANFLPEWQAAEVNTGDQFLTSYEALIRR